jgi:periplasmic protein TonB
MFSTYVNGSAWDDRSRRGWSTLVSFGLQAVAVGALLLLPLLSMQTLPQLQLMASLWTPAPPPGPPPATPAHSPIHATSNMVGIRVIMPTRIPREIENLNENEAPPPLGVPGEAVVPGGSGFSGARNFVPGGLGPATAPLPILAPPPAARPPRISHMMEGNLIHRVQPEYPQLARQARIQGTVVLRAIINRDGRIENLQVLSGHPMLVQAALDAVQHWRYRPYLLNNQPVEVETQITVNFTLSGG